MNKKKLLISAVAVVIILAGISAYWANQRLDDGVNPNLVTYKDPVLTDEQKQRFIDAIAKSKTELEELPRNAAKEERYQRYLSIASNYVPLGEYKKAQEFYLEAAELLPQYPLPWYGLSTVESTMQDFARAEQHLDKAIELDPANPEYWRFKFDLAKVQGNRTAEQMKELYTTALTKTNEHVDIISVYAKYASEQGDLVTSVQMWKKAIEKQPENTAVYEREIQALQDKLK